MRALLLWLTIAVAVAASACGHVAKIRPTPKGVLAADATLGGPIGQVEGYTLPLPLVTAGASYGLSDRLDVDGHLHLTSALFGVAGLDAGGTFLWLQPKGVVPALATNLRVYGFSDLRNFRGYVELTPSASWDLGDRFMAYVAGSAFVQLAGGLPLFSAAVGGSARFGSAELQLEGRWYQPNALSTNLPTRWASLGGLGAFGVLVSYQLRFEPGLGGSR